MACLLISAIHHVFHLLYQVYDSISLCNVKMMVYMTFHREICDIVNRS